jgi:hypothetical protein
MRRPGTRDLQGLRRYREELTAAIASLEELENFRRNRLEARKAARHQGKFQSAA